MAPTKIYPYSTPEGIRELVPLEDYEALKKAYDNQVKIKAALTQRPDLGDRAPRVQKLIEENAAMREAIREAAHAMDNLIIAKRGGMQPANALIDATTYARATLAKLQPYIKP